MEYGQQQPELALVPVPSQQQLQLVLRHGSSVVLYDPESRQVTRVHADDVDLGLCPTCHRPFEDYASESEWSPDFTSPDYFELLHHSRGVSVTSSRSTSPARLLRSQESTPLKDQRTPPRDSPRPSNISPNEFAPGYYKQHFNEIRELGRGGNGVVMLVEHVMAGDRLGYFAMKRIPVGDNQKWLTKVLHEVRVMQKLKHDNLVTYYHVWLEHFKPTAFTPSVPHVFILQQYCNGGDLQSYIFGPDADEEAILKRRGDRWTGLYIPREGRRGDIITARSMQPEEVFGFFKDIARGLDHLHKNGFIHRDLKPSNCLLNETGGRLQCLLSDFGETTGENVTRTSTGGTGTVSYCAPEVLKQDPVTGALGNFTQKSDIFSLGLILYLMCFGRLPYVHASPSDETTEDIDQLREEIAHWAGITDETKGSSNLPEVLSGSLSRLLSLKPNDRPTASEVVQGLKHFRLRARSRSDAGVEEDSWYSPTTEQGDESATSHQLRSTSQYKAPLVESDDPRSPPLSPVTLQPPLSRNALSRPPAAPEMSLVQRRRPKASRDVEAPTEQRMIIAAPRARQRTATLSSRDRHMVLTKVVVFLVKVWTVLAPCRSKGSSSWIAYPLLTMAAFDLSNQYTHLITSIGLAILHVCVLALARRYGFLC